MDLQIVKATPIELRTDARTSEVFHQIVDTCLRHATANVSQIAEQNADAVHQTRIGMRRLRSAIALFGEQLDKPTRRAATRDLRHLGKRLSPVRDWDVFIADTLPKLPLQGNDSVSMRTGALNLRTTAYHAIDYSAFEKLSTSVNAIVLNGPDLDEPIFETAPDLLGRQARKMKRCLKHLDTDEQRHALRKTLKKLRYSVEFLGSLYDDKAVKRYVDHCKDAQDALGLMNDTTTTISLLNALVYDPKVKTEVLAWAQKRQDKSIENVSTVTHALRSAKRFW